MLLSTSLPILFLALCAGPGLARHDDKVIVGYVLDTPDSASDSSQIDFGKITHLNIAFANPVDDTGTMSVPPNLQQIVDQAHRNHVRVLISIGGGSVSEDATGRQRYFGLIGDSNRPSFVRKLIDYVELYRLDGLDVDLEGPAINKDYAPFIDDLSARLKRGHKLLTAAVPGSYGGDQITSDAWGHFDLLNVMAYDATGPWEPNRPGPHSSFDFAKSSIAYWLGRGVPSSKLVLGVPFYGWGFGDAFTQGGYTFAEITAKYPGSESSDQVGNTIYYNGLPTIKAKAKYVLAQHLAGVMIWSLDQDAKGPLSLLAAIHDTLNAK